MLNWLTNLYEAFNPQIHIQGSIANFDLSSISGACEGMDVMKCWVREAIRDLRPSFPDVLTTTLKLSRLLFTFDRSSALSCINKAHLTHLRIPRLTYLDSDGRYIVQDIVDLFDGSQQTCISSGSKFLMYVSLESMSILYAKLLTDTYSSPRMQWIYPFFAIVSKGLLARFRSHHDFHSTSPLMASSFHVVGSPQMDIFQARTLTLP